VVISLPKISSFPFTSWIGTTKISTLYISFIPGKIIAKLKFFFAIETLDDHFSSPPQHVIAHMVADITIIANPKQNN
jgi:hypothetical protein